MSDQTTQTEAPAEKLVVMMDQLPKGDEPRAESPLYHADLKSIAEHGPKEGGVVFQEEALLGHMVIRGNAGDKAFKDGIKKVLGVELPGALQSNAAGDKRLCWISPDEWLLLLPSADCFKVEADLRDALTGHYAIVNVSGGQTLMRLSGENAVDVLKKSTAYDVHDRNFPVNKVVTSVFAKTQAVILRESESEWALIIRRSFADYAWLWIQEAAKDEFGLVVKA